MRTPRSYHADMRVLAIAASSCLVWTAGCIAPGPDAAVCGDDALCDDGLFCNGRERCAPSERGADARGCVDGRSPIEPSEDPCVIVQCDEAAGSVWLRRAPECGPAQGDPDPEPGPVPDTGCTADGQCDDGLDCTRDVCGPDGGCVFEPDHSVCLDDDACDGVERCEPASDKANPRGCVAGARPEAPPGPECTEAVCDPDTGAMRRRPTASCDCDTPGQPCADPAPRDCRVLTCSAEYRCVERPASAGASCDDGVDCTVEDACDAAGVCAGVGDDGRCDDGRYCNGAEFCRGGCVAGAPPVRSDGLDCTDDVCDEGTDSFAHIPGPDCGCAADADCQPPAPAACVTYRCGDDQVCEVRPTAAGERCEDGVACTQGDACDGAGGCVGRPDHGACDDGLWCTGIERCRPARADAGVDGCLPGPPPSVADDLECTDDLCQECDPADPLCEIGQSGRRVHEPTERCECRRDEDCPAPQGQLCAAGLCDAQTFTCRVVQAEAGRPCDDGLDCTGATVCDAQGRCAVSIHDHGACDDGRWCNGQERCDPARHDPAGPLVRGCAQGIDPRRDHPGRRPCAVLSCDEDEDRVVVDDSQCIDCVDVEVYADPDGDDWGAAESSLIACLEEHEELDGFARRAGDCVPDDPLRSPGSEDICADWVDDDCDGVDRICPESQPAAAELPDWDCVVGGAPIMVVAWALFEAGGPFYEDGMCFVFFEAYPGEYFVQPMNVRPRNPEHICPAHPDGTSTNPSLYAHTVAGPPQGCPLMTLEINYDVEILAQPMSNHCRKYVAQMESLGEFAFVSSDLDELRRRLAHTPNFELSCNRLTGQEDLPGLHMLSAPIQINPFFEPL